MINNRPVLLIVCEDITEGKRAAEALREVQTELAHANRVAALGQLTASIAHEVNQPIAGVLNSGRCRSALFEQARSGGGAAKRSSAWSGMPLGLVTSSAGIRTLVKKAPARTESFDMNEAIRDVIIVTRAEATKNGIWVEEQLDGGLAAH